MEKDLSLIFSCHLCCMNRYFFIGGGGGGGGIIRSSLVIRIHSLRIRAVVNFTTIYAAGTVQMRYSPLSVLLERKKS